jgi:hypothetical protein
MPIFLSVLLAGVLFSGCGGGGGAESGAAGSSSFMISSALANLYSSSQVFNLSATDGNSNQYSLRYAFSAPTSAQSPSSGYAYTNGDTRIVIQASLSANGGTPTTQDFTRYIRSSPFAYSFLQKGSGPFTLYSATASPPDSAQPFSPIVVSTGKVFATTPECHAAGMSNCFVGDTSLSLSLIAIDTTTALLCFSSSGAVPDTYVASAPEECARIDAVGHVLGLRVKFSVAGQILTFQ